MIQSEKQLFINDIYRKGMLNAELFRSPIEKGEIISCILPENRDITVINSENIPGKKSISFLNSEIPVLSDNSINYKGEAILILASDNHDKIENFKKKIEIEYKLNSSLNFHEENHNPDIIDVKKYYYPENSEEISTDNTDSNAVVSEDEFFSGEYNSRYCEPNGAVAVPEKNGNITVYTVSQWPDHVKRSVAEALNISPSKVNVIITELSSPLEGRIWYPSLTAVRAALAAYESHKPVKLFLNEKENNNFTPSQFPFKVKFNSRILKDKKYLSINIDIDAGSISIIDADYFKKTILSAALFYGFDTVQTEIRIIRTSKPPMSFISSFNFTQILSAFEIHITNTAVRLGENPYSWRHRNLFKKRARKYYNFPDVKSFTNSRNAQKAVIEKVVEMSDFLRKHASYELQRKTGINNVTSKKRGIGISVGFFDNDLPVESLKNSKLSLRLLLDNEGRLNIFTSTVPDGKSNYNIWKNIASEILGIDREDIKIAIHETACTPESSPYIFSKEIAGFSELLKKSCQSLQRKRFRAPLPIDIKRTVSLSKLKKGDISWGASVVEVEFDSITLETEIKGIWNCLDCGKIISRNIINKKIYSGIIDSLNWLSSASGSAKTIPYSDNSWKFYNVPITTEYLNSNNITRALSPGDIAMALIPGSYYYALKQAIGKDTFNIPFKESGFYNIIKHNDT